MNKKKFYNYNLTEVKNISNEIKFKRIGIIPYFMINNIPYYFLMRDSTFKEWTDCGGSPENNENWIDTAIRETKEESRSFFNFTKQKIYNSGIVCWREDYRIATIFVPIKITNFNRAYIICYKYRCDYLKGIEKKDSHVTLENSDLNFYSEEMIKKENKNIYKLVRCLLRAFFRLGGVFYCKPHKNSCCYNNEARRYNNYSIPTHERVKNPQTRYYYLKPESIYRDSSGFFSFIDSPVLNS